MEPNETKRGSEGSPAFLEKRILIIIGVLLGAVLFAVCFISLTRTSGGKGVIVIECAAKPAVSYPLNKNTRLLIRDGKVSEIGADETIETIMEPGSVSDCNILEVKDGTVNCVESNCANQVCVHTQPICGAGYEIPIVCLPHGVAIHIEGIED